MNNSGFKVQTNVRAGQSRWHYCVYGDDGIISSCHDSRRDASIAGELTHGTNNYTVEKTSALAGINPL